MSYLNPTSINSAGYFDPIGYANENRDVLAQTRRKAALAQIGFMEGGQSAVPDAAAAFQLGRGAAMPEGPGGGLGEFGRGTEAQRHRGTGSGGGGGFSYEPRDPRIPTTTAELRAAGKLIQSAPWDHIDTAKAPTTGGLDNFYKFQDQPSIGQPVNQTIFDRVPRYERGGFPEPGMPALVGEAGPEMIVPTGPSQIIPNDQLPVFNVDTNLGGDLPPFQLGPAPVQQAPLRPLGAPTLASNALDPYRRTLGRPTVGRESEVDKLLESNPGYKLHLQRTLRSPQGMAFMDKLEMAHQNAQNEAELEAFQQNRLDMRNQATIEGANARAAATAQALFDKNAVEHNFKLADESRKMAEFAQGFVNPEVSVREIPGTNYVIPFAGNKAMGTLPTNAQQPMEMMETFPGTGEYVQTRDGRALPEFGTAKMTDPARPEIDFPGMKLPFGGLPAMKFPASPAKFKQNPKGTAAAEGPTKAEQMAAIIKMEKDIDAMATSSPRIPRLQKVLARMWAEFDPDGEAPAPAATGAPASSSAIQAMMGRLKK